MPEELNAGYGSKRAQQPGMNCCGLYAACIEMEGEEANRDMKDLARYFVPVNKGSPVTMDRYET